MNKILMVATIPGTLRGFLLPFAGHFRNQGWCVDGMACGISACVDCVKGFNRVWDVQWSRNPLDPRNLMITPQVIQEIVQQEKYDIVHVHTPVASVVTRYALKDLRKKLNTKVIYTAHGFHFHPGGKPFQNAIFLEIEKFAANWHDHLVVINRHDEQAAKQYQFNPPDKIHYIPGIGVDINYYHPNIISTSDIELVRQELKLEPITALLLSVAEFIPRKRPQDVLKAFSRLDRPNTHLAFAGDGLLMNQMQQLAIQLGVENQVSFLGVRRDIRILMRAALTNILASEQEGLPRSVMESMCLETPVIGTDIRGTRDLLANGCGLLVKVGDVEALTQAMAWILDHPQESQIMGKKGRESITNYEISRIIKQYESLYAEATSTKNLVFKTDFAKNSKTSPT